MEVGDVQYTGGRGVCTSGIHLREGWSVHWRLPRCYVCVCVCVWGGGGGGGILSTYTLLSTLGKLKVPGSEQCTAIFIMAVSSSVLLLTCHHVILRV